MDRFARSFVTERTRRLWLPCGIARSDSLPQSDFTASDIDEGLELLGQVAYRGLVSHQVCVLTGTPQGAKCLSCCSDLNGRSPGAKLRCTHIA